MDVIRKQLHMLELGILHTHELAWMCITPTIDQRLNHFWAGLVVLYTRFQTFCSFVCGWIFRFRSVENNDVILPHLLFCIFFYWNRNLFMSKADGGSKLVLSSIDWFCTFKSGANVDYVVLIDFNGIEWGVAPSWWTSKKQVKIEKMSINVPKKSPLFLQFTMRLWAKISKNLVIQKYRLSIFSKLKRRRLSECISPPPHTIWSS